MDKRITIRDDPYLRVNVLIIAGWNERGFFFLLLSLPPSRTLCRAQIIRF